MLLWNVIAQVVMKEMILKKQTKSLKVWIKKINEWWVGTAGENDNNINELENKHTYQPRSPDVLECKASVLTRQWKKTQVSGQIQKQRGLETRISPLKWKPFLKWIWSWVVHVVGVHCFCAHDCRAYLRGWCRRNEKPTPAKLAASLTARLESQISALSTELNIQRVEAIVR